MGWSSGAPEQGWRKGPWTPEEDKLLFDYVTLHGEGRWSSVARCAGYLSLPMQITDSSDSLVDAPL